MMPSRFSISFIGLQDFPPPSFGRARQRVVAGLTLGCALESVQAKRGGQSRIA
jgi:hypothetical protein